MMRPLVLIPCAALAAASGTALFAAPQAITSPANLSKGTPIRVRLEMDLRSGRDKAGEPVLFTVDQNVYGPNRRLLLKKGDLARGHVIESAGHGAFGRAGKLTFTCDYAQADDGTCIPLNLTVVPKAGAKAGGESVGEVAASVSTGAHGYYPSPAPDGSPGEFYQQAGVTAGVSADIGRVLEGGADVTANRGQKYDATITANTLLAVAPYPAVPTAQLFTLKDKTQVTGALTSFDGENYTVETPAGRLNLRATDVQSIQAVSPVPKP